MIIGCLRIKNEARWIERSIRSFLPLCDRVLVFDDHSTDNTVEICESIPGVTVYHSPFQGLNECRDKGWLLEKATPLRPSWLCFWDGDEILAPGHQEPLKEAMAGPWGCLSLRIVYLWNDEHTARVDGVYGDFCRESIFRPNGARFIPRRAGANFHCGNVPAGNRINKRVLHDVHLLHTGYMHQEDRIRKYGWYREQDPNNAVEDGYRHMVVGDLFPSDAVFRYGGPLKLQPVLASEPVRVD